MKNILICLLLASASSLAVAADAPSVNGKWQVRMTIGTYQMVQVCTLNQTGTDLSVRCAGGMGGGTFTGKVHGRKISWALSSNSTGNSMNQIYQAELVSPTRFEGTVTIVPLGAAGDLSGIFCPDSTDDKACRALK